MSLPQNRMHSGARVLLNGRPVRSGRYGTVDLSTVPIEIVRSITVFNRSGAGDGGIPIVGDCIAMLAYACR